jgi:hypothetical protein
MRFLSLGMHVLFMSLYSMSSMGLTGGLSPMLATGLGALTPWLGVNGTEGNWMMYAGHV